MAKRRNLKKEKALRNQAYARKFRKRTNSRFSRRRTLNNNNNQEETDNSNQENTNEGAAADT
ncbi:MAG: hypothetical protein F6K09_16355 [Merismopedia sp. SIO2A8]|nr:hypothetical protein [Merismopedia sp. SIO2A8]